MIDLDQRVRRGIGQILDLAPPASDRPNPRADAQLDRPSRSIRPALVGASFVAVIGVAGVVYLAAGNSPTQHKSQSSSTGTTIPSTTSTIVNLAPPPDSNASLFDRLLYPSAVAGDAPEAVLGPEWIDQIAGLVVSPSGEVFRMTASAAAGYEPTPGLEHRAVVGNDYAVEFDGDLVFYSSIGTCTRIGIGQSAKVGIDAAWDADAVTLLAATSVDGASVTVQLPIGWQAFGTGGPGNLVQLTYDVDIAGAARRVNLMQMPDTPVATLMTIGSNGIQMTTLGGQPAWSSHDEVQTFLYWDDNGTAVSLASRDMTVDELKIAASQLDRGHASAWASSIDSLDVVPTGTVPPDVAAANAAGSATCGETSLTIR